MKDSSHKSVSLNLLKVCFISALREDRIANVTKSNADGDGRLGQNNFQTLEE